MTLRLFLTLFLFLPLAAGSSYWGYHVFSLLILILIFLLALALAEILLLRSKLLIGALEAGQEISRGDEGVFLLPLFLKSRWLPARLRITARYGHLDKSLLAQKLSQVRKLRPGDKEQVRFLIKSRHTGSLILDEILLEVRGLLGLFKFKRRFLHSQHPAEILVLPLAAGGLDTEVQALDHVQESDLERRPIKERSDEIDTIRDYQAGDDIRTIHWPLTARMDSLIVKEYEAPVSVRSHLILDDFSAYSLESDPEACDRALAVRDQILDAVTFSIQALLNRDMTLELHLGLKQSARERLSMAKETLYYRRLLAHLPPDSLPDLGQALGRLGQHSSKDRYLLFSQRLSESSAAAMVDLARQVSQLVFFYFEPPSKSREEDNALLRLGRSKVELVLIPAASGRQTGEGSP
ncbi:MAG: DUF58 domain-containing protein [Clostridiaceae bacterium]|jgi:uncharacterized protein (DUF58 family)|nr:DUF58 domain-containing protein [Clostridiaceae bacterium]